MFRLGDLVEFTGGIPPARINKNMDAESPVYPLYGQIDLQEDLVGIYSDASNHRSIRTWDNVNLLRSGDAIFSLISGEATIVGKAREGYLYTQNYIKMILTDKIDKQFLVYCINENHDLKKQLELGLQGSFVMKYTVKQLGELRIAKLPPLNVQQLIGEIYFNQLRVQAIKVRAARTETIAVLHQLREVMNNE